jgi:hypothetical protein
MKNHYKNEILTILCLFTLFSCVKEQLLEPSVSSSISEIKIWSQQNDKTSFASQINWEKVSYIQMNDSIQGILAPVIIRGKYKEFITFKLEGKRHGWYKSYSLLNPTEMEIKIQSISGQMLNAGIVRKAKSKTPKIKNMTMREMNFNTSFWNYIFGTFLQDVTVTAPRLYTSNDYAFFNRYQFDLSLFYDANNSIEGSSEVYGGSGFVFESYAFPEITNNLTNDCFKEVLEQLTSNNLKGKITSIISQFDNSKAGTGYDFTIDNILNKAPEKININGIEYISYIYGQTSNHNISLNIATLSTTSKEFIAKTIIHEILHVYLAENEMQDHAKISKDYIIPMAQLLNQIYGIDLNEAKILAAAGLQKLPNFSKILTTIDSTLTPEKAGIIISRFANTSNFKNYGTYCN